MRPELVDAPKQVIGDARLLEILPQPFDVVQVGAVGRQPEDLQSSPNPRLVEIGFQSLGGVGP